MGSASLFELTSCGKSVWRMRGPFNAPGEIVKCRTQVGAEHHASPLFPRRTDVRIVWTYDAQGIRESLPEQVGFAQAPAVFCPPQLDRGLPDSWPNSNGAAF